GASTVAELTVLGRPAILVPLPGSLDNDQLLNAQTLQRAGACWCMEQAELTADDLAQRLAALMDGPETLEAAARAARHLAQPAAVDRLADLVERLVHTAA
ncbi:MAG: glycosyltransferase, partial [Pseudomonadota bacterium]